MGSLGWRARRRCLVLDPLGGPLGGLVLESAHQCSWPIGAARTIGLGLGAGAVGAGDGVLARAEVLPRSCVGLLGIVHNRGVRGTSLSSLVVDQKARSIVSRVKREGHHIAVDLSTLVHHSRLSKFLWIVAMILPPCWLLDAVMVHPRGLRPSPRESS